MGRAHACPDRGFPQRPDELGPAHTKAAADVGAYLSFPRSIEIPNARERTPPRLDPYRPQSRDRQRHQPLTARLVSVAGSSFKQRDVHSAEGSKRRCV